MKLSDLESLKPFVERLLEADGWTVGKVATATAPALATYRGVSLKLAGTLIQEARALVNTAPPELPGPVAPSAPVDTGMSPRVRRAIMSSDQGWNK